MAQEYWLADSEARVVGPIGLDVVTSLHARGKLGDVRAVSRDGRTFVPLRDVPELSAVLSQPVNLTDTQRAQAETTAQIRGWLRSIEAAPSHEIFKVAPNAPHASWRAAFFQLVHRYTPSRLPPDTTPELRLACEDAFLALSERMVELEKQHRAAVAPPAPPPLPAQEPWPQARVQSRAGGLLHVSLSLNRGEARPFTHDVEHNWQSDSIFIPAIERAVPNTPVEINVSFEGMAMQLNAAGRVAAARNGGFSVRLQNLGEAQRGMIRTWVGRAGVK